MIINMEDIIRDRDSTLHICNNKDDDIEIRIRDRWGNEQSVMISADDFYRAALAFRPIPEASK